MKQPIIYIAITLCFAVNIAKCNTLDSLTLTKRIESMRQLYYVTSKDSVYQALAEILQNTREADQWQLSIETMITWATAANYFGDFATLQRYLQASQEIYDAHEEKNDNVLLSKLLFTKAVLYYQISDLELSNQTFQQCLKIADKNDSTMVTEIYFYLGDNYYDLGNYYLSAQAFDLAMQWVPHDEDYNFYLSQIINRRASLAVTNEDLEKGEQLFEKSLGLLINIEEYTPKNAISYGYLTLADVLIRRNKLEEALAALQAISQYLDDRHVIQIRISKFKGDIYQKKGQLAQAKASYKQTINWCTQHGNSIRKAEAYYQLAATYRQSGQLKEAVQAAQFSLQNLVPDFKPANDYSLPALTDVMDEIHLLEALKTKGDVIYAQYQIDHDQQLLQHALGCFDLAFDLIDKMRNNYQSPEYKRYVAKKAKAIYEKAIDITYDAWLRDKQNMNYQQRLYTYMERNKSRILLQTLPKNKMVQFKNIPDSLLAKEKKLQLEINFTKDKISRLVAKDDQQQLPAVRMQLHQSQYQLEQLVDYFQLNHPEYYRAQYATNIVELPEIQTALLANQAVVCFFTGQQNTYSLLLTRDKIWINKIDQASSVISQKTTDLLAALRQPGKNYATQAHELYQLLIAPLIKEMPNPINRVKIITDGALAYLPFEILSQKMDQEEKNQNMLLHQFAVSYAYSLSTDYYQQNKSGNAHQVSYAGFAPDTDDWEMAQHPFYQQQSNLVSLPAITTEVKQLARLFHGKSFYNREANEANFKTQVSQSKIIHIASHALIHDNQPQYSGLVFSNTNNQQFKTLFAGVGELAETRSIVEEDGFLHLHELYNMQINSDLAILSACETGFGTYQEGEGIMSLGQGFAYAGCPSIVMSYWQVNDQSTAWLINKLAEYLQQGIPKDVALQKAKINYLQSSDKITRHPYFWSAFVLLGNDKPMELDEPKDWQWWLGFVTGIAAIFLIVLFSRRNWG